MKFLLIGVAFVCAATTLTPLADATTQDDNFLAMLATAGIPAHDGIPSVIAAGHEVCDELDGGKSASEIAEKLANDAYAEAPVNSLDRYQRSMARFVQVSAQAFCPGHAGGAAWRGGYRIVPVDDIVEPPLPAVPEGPDVARMAPPAVVAKPKKNPAPEHKPPPPEVVPTPSQGSHGGQGEGGNGNGTDGGGTDNGGDTPPAPDSPGGHIVLLP